ncbi:AMP-binding protein [Streptomyces sp. SS1-1]|nr:AMP-binding protein [Streptomyces sp. SS1-1]
MKGLLARTDCIGPIPLPADALDGLRSLAAAAGVDEFTALSLCAGVLATRLPHPGTACRVRITRQEADAVVPGPGTPDVETTFRDALRQAARTEAPPAADPAEEPPVAVSLLIGATGRNLYVESLTDASDVPTPQAWAHAFRTLLTGLTDDPDAPMLSHPLVGPEERDRILHGLNPHREPVIRYRTMAGPFEEQAERTPDAVALQDEDGTTVSYRELNERANRLAQGCRVPHRGRARQHPLDAAAVPVPAGRHGAVQGVPRVRHLHLGTVLAALPRRPARHLPSRR